MRCFDITFVILPYVQKVHIHITKMGCCPYKIKVGATYDRLHIWGRNTHSNNEPFTYFPSM